MPRHSHAPSNEHLHGSVRAHPVHVRVAPWQIDVAQRLEEHHVCATSDGVTRRQRFTHDLCSLLSSMDATHVGVIDGARGRTLEGWCRELAVAVGVPEVAPGIELSGGVVDALRRRPIGPDGRAIRRRFLLWTDAHAMLREHPRDFARLIDAMMGVAAESEFVSEDVLIIQRAVFIGRPALAAYLEDPTGQMRQWYSEGSEDPLWRVITGVKAPRVSHWPIGDEVEAA